MNQKERLAYRRRLNVGEDVYFVEGQDMTGSPDEPLVVKKGVVEETMFSDRKELPYTWIAFVTPEGSTIDMGKSPRELFTASEVESIMNKDRSRLVGEVRPIDDVVNDPETNKLLVGALGGVVFERMADDLFAKPFDPERA